MAGLQSLSAALRAAEAALACIADRVAALPRRFLASQHSASQSFASLSASLEAAARQEGFVCRSAATTVEKGWEAAAEEARVRAAQLDAYALIFEGASEGGDAELGATACALLLLSDAHDSEGLVRVTWDAGAVGDALQGVWRLRDGIDAARCTVGGGGAAMCQSGVDNVVTVSAVDGEGCVVDSIEPGDVCLFVEGGLAGSVSVRGDGHVEMAYSVPPASGGAACATLSLCVCGAPLPRSPWRVYEPLGDCEILAGVSTDTRAAFLRVLTEEWLPGCHFSLLYRGSRDGLTNNDFHAVCDGKGPTLVLVRCEKGWVFGGYAAASWESKGRIVDSGGAFLFSVHGPHVSHPVLFPAKTTGAPTSQLGHAGYGPAWYGGLYVRMAEGSGAGRVSMASTCRVGAAFENVLGKTGASLTGDSAFVTKALEVYGVGQG